MSEAVRRVGEEAQGESMMVNLARLDTLLELAGEVIILSANLESLNRLVQSDNVADEIVENTKELAYTSTRISADLHRLVVDVRNVGMRDIFGRFRRLMRDTSRRLNRPVQFELEGEEVSLDKRIAERIFDPIAHQLRNALAHGIEDEQTRVAAGKSPVGRVSLKIEVLSASIRISVQDDGRGIDLDRVRNRIVEMGLLPEDEVGGLSDSALYAFLFRAGFSTSDRTTDVSGRGVGMNVIQEALLELDGDVVVESVPGQGTLVRMELPKVSAVNIIDALMVRANQLVFAFPLTNVLSSMAVRATELVTVMETTRSLVYLGGIIPVYDLLGVFGEQTVESVTGLNDEGELLLLVIEHKGRLAAFIVSEFLHPQKLVITGFDALEVAGIAGTAILAGRQLGMIVDVPSLLALAFDGGASDEGDGGDVSGEGAGARSTVKDLVAASAQEVAAPAAESAEKVGGSPAEDGIGQEFLRELEALIFKLNGSLLELEEKRDRETTDKVFRLAHSIKGNFTMCSIEGAAALTHQLETILDGARRDEPPLTDASFDVLFDGCAHLEAVSAALLAGKSAPATGESLSAAISALCASEPAVSSLSVGDGIAIDPAARFWADDLRRRGMPMHLLSIAIESGEQPSFLLAYLILQRVQSVADVLASSPSFELLERGMGSDRLEVLISPRRNSPDVLQRLEKNLREHFNVTGFAVESPDPGLI